jgi:drug/metabolite transporter (DMT)-like permease
LTTTPLSMIIAFGGYSLLNIAQACQKIGLGMMHKSRLKGTIVWVFATIGTTGSSFVLLSAVSMGNVSIVGAMAGTGLASLSLFSAFVMGERVERREMLGVAVVVAGAVLTGLSSSKIEPTAILIREMYLTLGAVAAAGSLAVLLLHFRRLPAGAATGCFAGALGGFIPKFQKVSTSELGKARSLAGLTSAPGAGGDAGAIFANPYALTWIALSVLSMVVLQFAFKRDKAISVIPAFTGSIIVIPVIGGVAFFGESFSPFQGAGVALILGGVMLITMKRKRENR